MTLIYSDSFGVLTSPDQLIGFFAGWPNPPDTERHLEILRRSYAVCLALDGTRCVGFINAISDGVFYAYIPLLEVLPTHRSRGVGKELVRRMVAKLEKTYAIDIVCDEAIAPFYAQIGFSRSVAMVKRNYANQNARA